MQFFYDALAVEIPQKPPYHNASICDTLVIIIPPKPPYQNNTQDDLNVVVSDQLESGGHLGNRHQCIELPYASRMEMWLCQKSTIYKWAAHMIISTGK